MTDATEQAIDQTMRIALTGVEYTLRMSGTATKNLAAGLWSVASTRQQTRGKARLESLLKSGKELKVFNVTTSELAAFAREAKRYGVLYAVIKGSEGGPDELVDILVKAEDAAKINRIVERLEYGKYDEAEVVVEAERELAGRDEGRDAADRSVQAKDTDELLKELVGGGGKEATKPNPTAAKTAGPAPSEPSSDKDGHPKEATSAERDAPDAAASVTDKAASATGRDVPATDREGTARSKTREGRGFDDGRTRPSVKAKIEQKRTERAERRERQPAKSAPAKHQAPQPKRKRAPKDKTQKGR